MGDCLYKRGQNRSTDKANVTIDLAIIFIITVKAMLMNEFRQYNNEQVKFGRNLGHKAQNENRGSHVNPSDQKYCCCVMSLLVVQSELCGWHTSVVTKTRNAVVSFMGKLFAL